MHTLTQVILAAPDGADFFTATTLGKVIASAMKAVALLVILGAVIKAVKEVMDGKGAKAAQIVVGALVIVAFLWKPDLIGQVIDTFAGLVGAGADTVDEVTNTR